MVKNKNKNKKKIKIIAEVGVNHNGNLQIAKKLIKTAKQFNADYVKFQSFKAEFLSTKKAKLAKYQKKNITNNQYNLLKSLELKTSDLKKLLIYSKKLKIKLLSTPFDIYSLNVLIDLGIKIIKIPSGEIDNVPLLEAIANKALEVIISTGMSTIQEIKFAINILKRKIPLKNITIMHCTSEYPTPPKSVNMNALNTIKLSFNCPIGYSDHTTGFEAGILAISYGAQIIEKHITLDKNSKGPDHKASLDPNEFKAYVEHIKTASKMMGSHKKKPTAEEFKIKKLVRKSIVAKTFIDKGDLFTDKNITCKRPLGGISSKNWYKVLGKKAKKTFKVDQFIKL